MPKYTLIPEFNLSDPEQCTDDLTKAQLLAEAFIAKYGAECPRVAVVEVRIIGYVEYARPIWTSV